MFSQQTLFSKCYGQTSAHPSLTHTGDVTLLVLAMQHTQFFGTFATTFKFLASVRT